MVLLIHDCAGRVVLVLVDEAECAGLHTVHWDGRTDEGFAVGSAMYFGILQFRSAIHRNDSVVKKIIRMR